MSETLTTLREQFEANWQKSQDKAAKEASLRGMVEAGKRKGSKNISAQRQAEEAGKKLHKK
jgi:hypothetical protein